MKNNECKDCACLTCKDGVGFFPCLGCGKQNKCHNNACSPKHEAINKIADEANILVDKLEQELDKDSCPFDLD